MELLHPGLLYLLPLAGVPIVLHLLTLHRLRTVELSTFRFLFDTYLQQRRQMKFLEALLAALRALFLLLLVGLCARPAVRHWSALFGGGAGRDVVLLVDCSASMNAQTAGRSALERAKDAALKVVDRLSPDDRLSLVRVAARPEEVFSRFTPDNEAAREQIDALQSSPSRGNWLSALSEVFPARSQRSTTPTVYLFTDNQASGWREAASQGIDRLVPDDARLVVVDVGSHEPLANRAVIGERPRQHRAIVGLPLVLRPRVANDSETDLAEVTVGVFVDDAEIARVPLTVKPGDSEQKEIVFTPTEPGVLHGRFEIDEDRFPDDDQYLFTLSISPPIKVLLVNGNPAGDPYENDALYLRTALTAHGEEQDRPNEPSPAEASAANEPAPPLGPSKEYVRSLDVQEIQQGQVNPDTLRDASVVILANCGGLNKQHFLWLHDFVSAGGGLMIFPGDRVNYDVYNKQFFAVPGPLNERLTPVEMGPPVGDPQKPETFVQLSAVDFAHPALAVFDDPDARYLTTAHFSRRFPLTFDEAAPGGWALARFSPKQVALVENRFRDGAVLVAAFPMHAKWTNLPLKPEFVPLVLRLVNHLEHRPELETPSVVPADGVAEIAVAGEWSPLSGRVIDGEQRSTDLEFKRAGSRFVSGYEQTSQKGYYAVEVKGGRVEQPKRGAAEFAVNLAPDESEFAAASEAELSEWFPGVKLSFVDASAEAQQELGSVGDQREIWRYLLYAAFAVIGAEFLLATRSGQGRNGEEASMGERIRQLAPGAWVGQMTGAGDPAIGE
ncbi:MAG TPA: vWA domain-containing protein [Pirellulales bacterium]|nr:vWA domain-containing protein [Pirellulales bacterium]